MQIFVVLATREREDFLERTLTSLAQCRRPGGFAGTLVVENGHRGDAERVVREAATTLGARHLFEPVGNKCRALNRALAEIEDGLVVFLDDDVRVAPEVLESYATAARQAGRGHFLGGPVEPEYEEAPPKWLTAFLPASARGWRPDESSRGTLKPFFVGFNWAAFAGDLRRVGGFDERLGPGTAVGVGDESDVQRRLAAVGVQPLYVRAALVHHWVPRARCSPAWTLDRAYRTGIGRGLKASEAPGLTIAGYPVRLVERAARSWLGARLRQLSGDPGEQFAALVRYQRQRGVLRGAVLGRRSDTHVTGHERSQATDEATAAGLDR